MENSQEESYIAALDIGSTFIKCYVYSKNMKIVGSASSKVRSTYKFQIHRYVYVTKYSHNSELFHQNMSLIF